MQQARFLFQRLVVALGRELFPYLAPMVVRLVRDCRLRDVIDIAPVIGQLVYRFKVRVRFGGQGAKEGEGAGGEGGRGGEMRGGVETGEAQGAGFLVRRPLRASVFSLFC